MSMSRARSAGQSGAKGIISATLSNGVSWVESFRIDVAGAEISGADTSAWQLNLRDESGSVVLSVSESAGTLTVTNNTTYTLFEINVPYSSLSDLCGDYRIDLVEQTAAGVRVHWGSGVATVRDEPVWSS
jgi:hypothetical protein